MYAVACTRGSLLTSMETKKFQEGKHFCLELMKDFPPVRVDKASIKFSSDRAFSIDPGKHARINTGFYIHQKGDYLIHFEPTRYYSNIMMVPPHSSMKTIGPYFNLVNYSDCAVSIPSHKKIFKATFVPIDDVDIYQDLPQGNGRRDMQEREKDIHSLNYLEYQEAKDRLKKGVDPGQRSQEESVKMYGPSQTQKEKTQKEKTPKPP